MSDDVSVKSHFAAKLRKTHLEPQQCKPADGDTSQLSGPQTLAVHESLAVTTFRHFWQAVLYTCISLLNFKNMATPGSSGDQGNLEAMCKALLDSSKFQVLKDLQEERLCPKLSMYLFNIGHH